MKHLRISKILTIGLVSVVTVTSSFASLPAIAVGEEISNTMTVSPMSSKVNLIPGESYRSTIKVSNPNSATSDLPFALSVKPYSESGTTKDEPDSTSDLASESTYTQMPKWISFDYDHGTVQPNGVEEVPYTITVPSDAPAGGQYAAIIVHDDRQDNVDAGNVTIQNSYDIASIVYANVAGTTRETGEILDNHIPSIVLTQPLTVSSVVKNSGNVHADAQYILQIWPLFSDEELYTNEENAKESLIMPETERYNTQTWDNAPFAGIFKVRQTVKIFGETSVAEKMVIICPLWLLITIIIAIIALIVWLYTRSKSHKKSK